MTVAVKPHAQNWEGEMMIADDDARDAWQLHHEDGLTWSRVAKEMGYSEGAVRKLADAYLQRTDAAAAEHQIALF